MTSSIFKKVVEISFAMLGRHCEEKSRHFSFLIYKNKIVSIGTNNTRKTHPYNLKNKYQSRENTDISNLVGTHSELSAVIRYGWENLDNHILINTRINLLGRLANSKPCSGCQNLVSQLRIKEVFYTKDDGTFIQY